MDKQMARDRKGQARRGEVKQREEEDERGEETSTKIRKEENVM